MSVLNSLAANWLPIVITLAIGFLLGWLITGLPPRRKLAQVQAEAEGLDVKLQQANSILSASQQRERGLQGNLDAANATPGYIPANAKKSCRATLPQPSSANKSSRPTWSRRATRWPRCRVRLPREMES